MSKKKSKTKVIIITAFILLIVLVSVAYYFISTKAENISVTTTKVGPRTITQTVSAIGTIQPETEVKISSETSGEIIFLGVNIGDTVKKGTLIVRIKPDIIETQLEQFKAAADASKMEINIRKAEKDRAQNDLKRMTELFEKEFISKQEFERAQVAFDQAIASYRASLSRYDQALATLKQFQRSADRTSIFAPIDGIVTKLDVEKGEKVVGTAQMQGTEMMRISDLRLMNSVVDVDENDVVLVKVGDTARIEIDAFPDSTYTGIVVEVGHSAKTSLLGSQDQVTNFEVKVRITDEEPRLRPGMSSNVEIETKTRNNVLAVPLQAVTVREEKLDKSPDVRKEDITVKNKKDDDRKVKRPQSVVFLNKKGNAELVPVKTGISDRGFIEILEGLNEGDEVISGSFMAISKQLEDGSAIKVDTVSKGKRKNWKKK